MYARLKKFCRAQGVSLFGVADLSGFDGHRLDAATMQKFPRAVCLGAALSKAVLEEVVCQPTRLYFHHYRTANMFLDQTAFRVTGFIQDAGYRALPVPASQIVDWENQTAHLSHKHAACAAGLGWIGRNNLLVTERYGSQVRLVTVLTDMPLPPDRRSSSGCGPCRACVEACPAGAIREDAREFDHQACFAKLKEFQKLRLVDQYICGVCVRACQGGVYAAPVSCGEVV
jgi:epoxyqueuosine reductase QueG